MIIIDSQVHIWAAETPDKPYATINASKPHRPEPLGHEELLREMDGAGVDRVILVPPSWEGNRNDTSLEAARLHPSRFAVMGKLPMALEKQNAPERPISYVSGPDVAEFCRKLGHLPVEAKSPQ